MKNPKVTVLMPVYNGERHLRGAIESILSQHFSDFEFLIIDDGSTDYSHNIILTYSDARIRLVENGNNLGLTCSLNKGIFMARGIYIARLDADDIAFPERLEKQVSFLDSYEEVVLVGSNYSVIDEQGRFLYRTDFPTEANIIKETLLKENCFGHSTIMFRRKDIQAVGGYRSEYFVAEDYDLYLRLADACPLANLSDILVKYRFSPRGVSVKNFQEQAYYAGLARLSSQRRRSGKKEVAIVPSPRSYKENPLWFIAGQYFKFALNAYGNGYYRRALLFFVRCISIYPKFLFGQVFIESISAFFLSRLYRRSHVILKR